jgi:hypothetical protein
VPHLQAALQRPSIGGRRRAGPGRAAGGSGAAASAEAAPVVARVRPPPPETTPATTNRLSGCVATPQGLAYSCFGGACMSCLSPPLDVRQLSVSLVLAWVQGAHATRQLPYRWLGLASAASVGQGSCQHRQVHDLLGAGGGVTVLDQPFIHLISPISPRRGGFLRVRVEIMGSQKCRTVGKSQPVLSMSHPVVSPRTRTECAAVIEPADVPRQLATQCTSFVVSRSRARAGTGSGRLDPDCCACPTNDPSAGDLLARVLADLLGCRAVLHRLSRGPWGRRPWSSRRRSSPWGRLIK